MGRNATNLKNYINKDKIPETIHLTGLINSNNNSNNGNIWRHDWSSQLYTQLKQLQIKPEKNILFKPEFVSGFNFTTA